MDKYEQGCRLVDGILVCRTSKTEKIIQAIKSEAPSLVCAGVGIANPIAGASCVIIYHGAKMGGDVLRGSI